MTDIEALGNAVLRGKEITHEEALALYAAPLEPLAKKADEIRARFCGNAFDLCAILNAKSGRCPENCKFCAQSARYATGAEEYPLLRTEEIVHAAKIHAVQGVLREMERVGLTPSRQTTVNLPSRIRMATLYAVAQSMNGRVSNNGNRSEKHVGYCTIYGDMAGDFSAISAFTVTEVIAIGEYLGIPDRFIHKDPSDGLTGKTDEDNFGFTYEELDTYILTGVCE